MIVAVCGLPFVVGILIGVTAVLLLLLVTGRLG